MSAGGGGTLRAAAIRLTVQFTALTLLALVVVGGVVFALVNAGLAEATERALVDAAQLDSPQDAPMGTYITILGGRHGGPGRDTPDGLVDDDAIEAVARGSDSVRSSRMVDGRSYELLTMRRGDAVVQVAVDQHERDEEIARLSTALIVAGMIALLVSAGAAYLMARRAIRPLAEALALQRRFVADASHELRTPLTILSTRAQLLQRRTRGSDVPADVPDAVDQLVGDARTLGSILDDLLIAADPRRVAEPALVDVVAVADEAIGLLADEAADRGIALARAGAHGADGAVAIAGSRAAVLRLYTALVSNALDHARSTVTLSVSVEGRACVIRVADDGPGFPPDLAEHAFERFSSTRTGENGVRHYGLGLAIVSEIVDRHGGSVEIEPSQSGGTVAARLPLARSTTSTARPRG